MRETYVIRDGELVPKRLAAPLSTANHQFLPDIAPITLPNGEQITSRSQLRAYEARHGVRQLGNDWPGSNKPQWWDAYKSGALNRG